MEENKEIKKKKMPLYLIAIAIVLAVLGVMDLKVNAAEQYSSGVSGVCEYYQEDVLNNTRDLFNHSYSSSSPITLYIRAPYDVPSATLTNYYYFVVSDSPITRNDGSAYYNQFTDLDGKIKYVYFDGGTITVSRPNVGKITMTPYNTDNVFYLLQGYNSVDEFVNNYLNGSLDIYNPPIDYDSFQIDDSMAIPDNLLYNIIRNKKTSENDTTGLGIIKDIEYYEYLTWNNTANYKIQVDSVPIVQVYTGMIKEEFVKEFYGEWLLREILEENTSSYTKRTDSSYLFEDSPQDKEFEQEILDTYVDFGDNTYLRYGYRIRYVDEENMKASPWLYALPNENGEYVSYKEYSDGTTTDNEDIKGTDNTYEDIDDIEDAKEDVNKENDVKNEYQIVDGDADVGEITNWLNSVTGFIKSSPSVIGSVLSFLPQPILYGLFITIFLGVFATAVGIIKALI